MANRLERWISETTIEARDLERRVKMGWVEHDTAALLLKLLYQMRKMCDLAVRYGALEGKRKPKPRLLAARNEALKSLRKTIHRGRRRKRSP